MSEYTMEEILRLIEENGGPEGLDLSGKDLSGIDLGRIAVAAEVEKARERAPSKMPVWFNEETRGANLQEADLRFANLQGADLVGTNLQGVRLGHANLQEADLRYANLHKASLVSAKLQKADLRGVNLQEANLGGANLQRAGLGAADLQRALLLSANLQKADLRGANLQGAFLLNANLQGANLRRSHLEEVDFFVAKSLEGTYFYHAFLDDTRLRRQQLGEAISEELDGEYDKAQEAYLALKNNFAEIGRYKDESWAYVKERRMGKMCGAPWRARRFHGETRLGDVWTWEPREGVRKLDSVLPTWHPRVLWFYTRHTLKWLADWFVELLCDYGESLWRVLAWMLLVILGFAAYYQVSHAVVTSSRDAATSLWDHLIFSLGAFTTLQPARLQAARPGVELLTTIQAIIGISLAGLLGFVAGNRIRRS